MVYEDIELSKQITRETNFEKELEKCLEDISKNIEFGVINMQMVHKVFESAK